MSRAHSRVVLVIASLPASLINFRGELLKSMQAKGHRVFAAAPGLLEDSKTERQLRAAGIECRNIALERTGLNLLSDARLLAELVGLMRSLRPDVVFAYTVKPVVYGMIAASLAGVSKKYAMITGLGYAFTGKPVGRRRLTQWALRALYRVALGRANKVFFQNTDDAGVFRDFKLIPAGLPVVLVNGSGIDLERFAVAPLPPPPIRFLLIARLLSAKGIREYAAAARLVGSWRRQAQFHLVGGFDRNPDALLAEEVDGWVQEGVIDWHGEVEDVRPHITACHVYVLPSYREGTPRSVLEAMATGRAIVTSDAPGCRETVVDGENGFLVPTQSVEPLAQAMRRLIDDPDLMTRMGRRSREIAESKFDVRKVNAHMMNEMELA